MLSPGLGAMGYPMAKNIRQNLSSQAQLWIFDVDSEVCDRFIKEFESFGSIFIASSTKQVAQKALTIVSIVPAGNHVRQVYLDPEHGVLASKGEDYDKERVYIECSTIDMQTAVLVGTELAQAGMGKFIDCPVSVSLLFQRYCRLMISFTVLTSLQGGVPAADAGTLSMLIGAAEIPAHQKVDSKELRIRHILNSMGAPGKQYYCGGLGFGLAAKICNNYLSCTILLANAEAMATGVKLGLDSRLLHKIIQGSTGQNYMLDNVCPVPGVVSHAPSSNDYRLGFKSQMLSKDVGLGVDAATSVDVEPSIGSAAIAVFNRMTEDGGYTVGVTISYDHQYR